MQNININGLNISFCNGKLTIDGLYPSTTREKTIIEDTDIRGDVNGNITVKGNNVTINISGDVVGNITNSTVSIKGDITGNIIGGSVRRT